MEGALGEAGKAPLTAKGEIALPKRRPKPCALLPPYHPPRFGRTSSLKILRLFIEHCKSHLRNLLLEQADLKASALAVGLFAFSQ